MILILVLPNIWVFHLLPLAFCWCPMFGLSSIIKFVSPLLLSIAWNSCDYWNYLNQKYCIQNVFIVFLCILLNKNCSTKNIVDLWFLVLAGHMKTHKRFSWRTEHLAWVSSKKPKFDFPNLKFQKTSLIPKDLAGEGMSRYTVEEQEPCWFFFFPVRPSST